MNQDDFMAINADGAIGTEHPMIDDEGGKVGETIMKKFAGNIDLDDESVNSNPRRDNYRTDEKMQGPNPTRKGTLRMEDYGTYGTA